MRVWLVSCALLAGLAGATGSDWEAFHEEDGITVWRRPVPGSSFVAFRGRGNVHTPILQVAAVLRAAGRAEEWMHQCSAAHIIAYKSPVTGVVYNRTESPVFFISDRDTVLVNEVIVDAASKTVTVAFHRVEHPLAPPVDGVVRMPKLLGHWKLRQVDRDTTEVEYQVEADPGGSLPAWLVNLVSKKLPYHTLQGLRRQARRGGYEKDRTILRLALDWSGFDLPSEGPTLRVATSSVSGL